MLRKRIYPIQDHFFSQPLANEYRQGIIVKALVPIIVIVSTIASAYGGNSIQELLVAGYGIIGQLSVPFIIDICKEKYSLLKDIPITATVTGMIVGVILAVGANTLGMDYSTLKEYIPGKFAQINIGIFALFVNILIISGMTAISRSRAKNSQGCQI